MRNMKEKVNSAATSIIGTMLKKDPREWPPDCIFLLYQPKRPCVKKADEKAKSHEAGVDSK